MNIGEIIKEYRDLRENLDAARKVFTQLEKDTDLRMLELETQMLELSRKLGVESFRTEYGTAFKTTKTYARLSAGENARELREEYAMKTGDFGLFTAHVNKTHAKELLDAGVNLADVGIDWVEEYTFRFQKPSK